MALESSLLTLILDDPQKFESHYLDDMYRKIYSIFSQNDEFQIFPAS